MGERFALVYRRRAAVVVFVAVTLPILFGMAALTIDLGRLSVVRAELQNTADAGALAGASRLPDEIASATTAEEFIGRNQHIDLENGSSSATVEVGNWDTDTKTFTADSPPFNAVRVAVHSTESLFFAQTLGLSSSEVGASAIATRVDTCKIWGTDDARLSGHASTDSYDSSAGPYFPGFAGSNGHVCSCGEISVANNAEINGEARTFPAGACPEIMMDFGDVEFNNDNATIGLSDDGKDPFSGGAYEFKLTNGDNITFLPGTYYFESMELSGGATLVVDGPTLIYVSGDIRVTGSGVINLTADPENLSVISSGDKVEWSGGSAYYGTLVAPNADVKIRGGAHYYGGVYGRTLDLGGGSEFHVDESLPSVEASPPVLVQ